MSGPVDDALHTPQVFPIRSLTPIVNTEPEVRADIDMEIMLPHPSEPLPGVMKTLENSNGTAIQLQPDQAKKFLPVIQLPNGQYISLNGDPVKPSIPSVVIPSTYVDVNRMLRD